MRLLQPMARLANFVGSLGRHCEITAVQGVKQGESFGKMRVIEYGAYSAHATLQKQ